MSLFEKWINRHASNGSKDPVPDPATPTPTPGRVLIEASGAPSFRVESCLEKHAGCRGAQASLLLRLLPQVVEVDDIAAFCAEMRALNAVVWPRDAWPGTDEAWAEAERRQPPFRLGRYDVHCASYPYVILFACPVGGV